MSFTESKIDAVLSAGDLPEQLAAALAAGRRGGSARMRMSPAMSYGRHAGPAPHTARRAAVMLLLFRRDHPAGGAGRWHLPLTERPATLARHGGQISLPGGAVDPGESSRDAALRELNEELGIDGGVKILGPLADCYVFASDFLVTPWIGLATFDPQWKPYDHEVQRVVELPLETLLDDRCFGSLTIQRGPLVFRAPCIRIEHACIWGATSVILGELAQLLQEVLTADERG